jgi:hypothetical protein
MMPELLDRDKYMKKLNEFFVDIRKTHECDHENKHTGDCVYLGTLEERLEKYQLMNNRKYNKNYSESTSVSSSVSSSVSISNPSVSLPL